MPRRTVIGGVLIDMGQRLLTMSHEAKSEPDRVHLLRAARQMKLVGEQVANGAKTLLEGQAWIDAGRIFVFEWEVQHAPVR